MSMTAFESMTVQEMRENLADLVRQVAQGKQRVEVQHTTGERCVLIAKHELDSLEQAISILSDTDEFRDISNSLSRLATATTQPTVA